MDNEEYSIIYARIHSPGHLTAEIVWKAHFLDREEFDAVIQNSLANTLKNVGEDSLAAVLSLLSGDEGPAESLAGHLGDIDAVLDELFGKFSKIVKHITILQASSQLKAEPPGLGRSLFWMVEELRSTLWKAKP
jgi:hypothetical protein